ncbi:MAG: RpiB/LacA/LacB family sugar-phosphate isomerase [Candidatus Yonathbacteria bacterium]|nr:RpiB/LacA/LacB family sugar-phosphate isomerase [Candidatus Yonathbacteria bacterium]NTW47471.1 RpiB/LacA/LacB family sugar-phosphate isomerase [Candidatus Yonathbacteria bacterium]
MILHIAADHAGHALKEYLVSVFRKEGYEVTDHGAHAYNKEDDYPDFIYPAARAVGEASLKNEDVRGIIIGGSGQGEAMVANRVLGVRAAVWYGGDRHIPLLSREHNDANILSLGARFMDKTLAEDVIKEWLAMPFSNDDRHVRRIKKIDGDVNNE